MKNLAERLKQKEGSDISIFIGHLFTFRNDIHLAHLNTKSYAKHIALNELYTGMLDIIDNLAETAQTDKLLNITIPASMTSNTEPLTMVESMLSYIRENRQTFPYSFQQNEIDNLELLLSKTIYKLKFLN